jgi:tetratricopeptide (TPR) repeat protein
LPADRPIDFSSDSTNKEIVMMLRISPTDVLNRSLAAGRILGVLAVAVAAQLLAGPSAFAQITTDQLIGDSVSDAATKYPDVDEAIKRFNNRDVLGARQFLEAAGRKNNALPPVDLSLAKMFFLSGNAAAGQASLEKNVMENPGDPEAYLILGDQAIQAGHSIEADALYEKALALIDKFDGNAKRKRNFVIRVRNGHSVVAERRKNWQTTIDDLQALLQVDPDNSTAHYRLGRALFMLGKSKDGYDQFAKASELDKEMMNPYVASALVYEQLGKRPEAQKAFDRAISANKSDVKVLTSYASWLLQTGDEAKAESVLADARKIDPDNLDVLSLSGVAARMAKKMKPAEDYLMAALRLAPSNGGVTNQLALLLVDQPDDAKRQRALEFAKINAMLRPDSPEANVTLAWVLYQTGNNRDAGTALQKALQSGSLGADSSYQVAKMLADQNQTDAAKQFLTRALDPTANGGGLFIMHEEAEALKAKLGDK